MTTQEEPLTVKMWHATTLDGTRRDFRLLTGPNPSSPTPHPVIWFNENVTKVTSIAQSAMVAMVILSSLCALYYLLIMLSSLCFTMSVDKYTRTYHEQYIYTYTHIYMCTYSTLYTHVYTYVHEPSTVDSPQ